MSSASTPAPHDQPHPHVLWAPWRMAYVGGDQRHDDCIFCSKPTQDRDEENLVLLRSEHVFVLMNLFPYNSGHVMVAPYAHQPTIQQLDPETLTDLMTTAQRCLAAIDAALHPHGYNMGINQGAVAGAGILDHVHYHIVPRWNGDTNFMPVLADTKVMPDHLLNTYRQIKAQLSIAPHRPQSPAPHPGSAGQRKRSHRR